MIKIIMTKAKKSFWYEEWTNDNVKSGLTIVAKAGGIID